MSDGFEWVSSDNPPEEKKEKKALPVVVNAPRGRSFGYRLWLVIQKALSIIWFAFLTVAARFLLLIIRTKYPKPRMPEFAKRWGKQLVNKARGWRKHAPALFVVPRALYYWRPPADLVHAFLSGACFVAVLLGIGSLFSSFENGVTLLRVFFIICGLIAGFWLLWRRGFTALVAKWILRAAKQRSSR